MRSSMEMMVFEGDEANDDARSSRQEFLPILVLTLYIRDNAWIRQEAEGRQRWVNKEQESAVYRVAFLDLDYLCAYESYRRIVGRDSKGLCEMRCVKPRAQSRLVVEGVWIMAGAHGRKYEYNQRSDLKPQTRYNS
ncbi:hypothetical protein HAX54_016661, partial [Datura stramonium]|nr:hypothetical protein [Datura stramonium]